MLLEENARLRELLAQLSDLIRKNDASNPSPGAPPPPPPLAEEAKIERTSRKAPQAIGFVSALAAAALTWWLVA